LILQAGGDLDGAMRLLKEQEAICRHLNDPAGLQRSLGNQALILKATGDLDGAMRLLKEAEAICRRLNDPAGLQRSLGNQALILKATGDLDGAMRLLKEQEAICRRLNDPNGLAISLANQASLLAFNHSQPADGLPLVEEGLRLATQHGLTALARQIEPILNRIRKLPEQTGSA
jgi:tetratricopeptide (TPR) repeat protein